MIGAKSSAKSTKFQKIKIKQKILYIFLRILKSLVYLKYVSKLKTKQKVIFIILNLLQANFLLAKENIYWRLNTFSETNNFFEQNSNNSSFSTKESLSIKFNLENFSSYFSVKTKTLNLSDFELLDENLKNQDLQFLTILNLINQEIFQTYALNFQYFINSPSFPICTKLYAGNLKFSDSISRLKNPTLSVPSALKKSVLIPCGIKISSSENSSTSTLYSAAINLSSSQKFKNFPTIQLAYLHQDAFFASINKNFSTNFIIPLSKISFGLTYALTKHGNLDFTSKSWNLSQAFYPQKFYSATESLITFSSPFFKTSTIFQVNENPFGKPNLCTKNQNSLNIENFTLNFSVFWADKNFITCDGTFIKPYFQYNFNPQYLFFFPHSDLNVGLLFQQNRAKTISKLSEFFNEYFFKAQFVFNLGNSSFSSQSAFSGKNFIYISSESFNFFSDFSNFTDFCDFESFDEISFSQKISYSLKSKNFSTKSYLLFKTDFSQNVYNANFSFYLKNSILKNFSFAFSLTEENFNISKTEFASTLNFSFSTKNLKSNFKISANFSS